MKLLFICNFRNVHSRTFISYFARRPDYDVTVFSTFPAAEMKGVRLVPLGSAGERPRKVISGGRAAGAIYRFFMRRPALLVHARNLEMLYQIAVMRRRIRAALEQLQERFDLVHAFRSQPEGVAAMAAVASDSELPFVLSTWGQDFVLFSRGRGAMRRSVRKMLNRVDVLLPDNARDERLARDVLGLKPSAISRVVPATGGLQVERLAGVHEPPALVRGAPTLLSMRGYENVYIRLRVLLQAHRIFLEEYPDAHLYVDLHATRQEASRDAVVAGWIAELDLERHVTVLHLQQHEVFGYMKACDMYVSATMSDGLPMSLLEALYLGQIAVVRNHESTRPVTDAAAGAFTFDHMDPATIARSWSQAMHAAEPRGEREARNRTMIEEDYVQPVVMAKVEALYGHVTGRHAGNAA